MSRLFPREHFETAQQYGVEGFDSIFGQTAAELNLTLQRLDESHGPFGFSRADLAGYQFLHHGTSTAVTDQVIGAVLDPESTKPDLLEEGPWSESLKTLLPEVLVAGKLTAPTALGRVLPLPAKAAVPDFIDLTYRPVGISAEDESDPPASEYRYPNGNTFMSYLGRQSMPTLDLYFNDPTVPIYSRPAASAKAPLSVNMDLVKAGTTSKGHVLFAVISFENALSQTRPVEIVQVGRYFTLQLYGGL